jgi:hypothetical protein
MSTLINQNLPYKIYSANNMGINEGMVYLGKIPNSLTFSQKTYSDEYYQNCFSGYYLSIASLVPGSCIRMDPADTVDSNILIDAKWYDFRPCSAISCDASNWPSDNILYNVDYSEPMKTKPLFKSLTTDGTVVISGLDSNFIWNDGGINNKTINSHCTLYLQAWKYQFENTGYGIGTYYGTIGTPGESNVVFLMKSLIGRNGILVQDYGCQLVVSWVGNAGTIEYPITCDPFIPLENGSFI